MNDERIKGGRRRLGWWRWLGPRLLYGLLRRRSWLVRELYASAWRARLCPRTNGQEEQTAKVKHRIRMQDSGTTRQVRVCDENCYGAMVFCQRAGMSCSAVEERTERETCASFHP